MKKYAFSYFKDYDFPLSEATRLQLFLNNSLQDRYSKIYILNKSELFRNKKISAIQQLNIFSFLATLIWVRLNKSIEIEYYGPLGGSAVVTLLKLINFDNYFLTDGGDVLKHKTESFIYIGHPSENMNGLCLLPALESKWADNFEVIYKDTITISYMSHLSEFKGILDVLSALILLKGVEQKKIIFRLATNSIREEKRVLAKLNEFKKKFEGEIELYGKVDPIKFLRETDIYIYPFHGRRGTFNVPLSLLEATLSGAFPIGPNHTNTVCWIGEDCTVNVKSPEEIKALIERFMAFNINDRFSSLSAIRERILKNIEFVTKERN